MTKEGKFRNSKATTNKHQSLDNDRQEKVFDRLETISVRHHVREKKKNINEVFIQYQCLSIKKNVFFILKMFSLYLLFVLSIITELNITKVSFENDKLA